MSTGLRYPAPADNRRPHQAARYDAWSPKVRRLVKLFGARALSAWIAIESNPSFTGFCERPTSFAANNRSRLIDFWVQSGTQEEFWLLLRPSEQLSRHTDSTFFAALHDWAERLQITVRFFAPDESLLSNERERNWSRILPYLAANHDCLSPQLIHQVQSACATPTSLAELEKRFKDEDPVLIRTSVFVLVHRGQLQISGIDSADFTHTTQVMRS